MALRVQYIKPGVSGLKKKKARRFPSNYELYVKYQPCYLRNKVSSLFTYKDSERYIQCQLFYRLQLKGIDSIPEYTDTNNNRYDLLVLRNGIPILIIEVKGKNGIVDAQQLHAYNANSFGVPVLLLKGRQEFVKVFNKIVALHDKSA